MHLFEPVESLTADCVAPPLAVDPVEVTKITEVAPSLFVEMLLRVVTGSTVVAAPVEEDELLLEDDDEELDDEVALELEAEVDEVDEDEDDEDDDDEEEEDDEVDVELSEDVDVEGAEDVDVSCVGVVLVGRRPERLTDTSFPFPSLSLSFCVCGAIPKRA